MTEEMTVQADVEKAAQDRNLDPLMERTVWRLLSEVPKRLLTVTMKMLSMKGVAFVTATVLLHDGYLESWAWLATTLVLIFGEKALTMIKDLRSVSYTPGVHGG